MLPSWEAVWLEHLWHFIWPQQALPRGNPTGSPMGRQQRMDREWTKHSVSFVRLREDSSRSCERKRDERKVRPFKRRLTFLHLFLFLLFWNYILHTTYCNRLRMIEACGPVWLAAWKQKTMLASCFWRGRTFRDSWGGLDECFLIHLSVYIVKRCQALSFCNASHICVASLSIEPHLSIAGHRLQVLGKRSKSQGRFRSPTSVGLCIFQSILLLS